MNLIKQFEALLGNAGQMSDPETETVAPNMNPHHTDLHIGKPTFKPTERISLNNLLLLLPVCSSCDIIMIHFVFIIGLSCAICEDLKIQLVNLRLDKPSSHHDS